MTKRMCNYIGIRNIFAKRFSTTTSRGHSQNWQVAINEGERMVDYPNLKRSLSDEISNVALSARKLSGTRHPVLKTIKNLIYDSKRSILARGLVILLLSKAAIPLRLAAAPNTGYVHDITQNQQSLAQIIEMVHMFYHIHLSVINTLPAYFPETNVLDEMVFGNKIAVLCGDYLLVTATEKLANMRNNKVTNLIHTSISQFTDAVFWGKQDRQGQCCPDENLTIDDWRKKNLMGVGSLMANSCIATLELEPHDDRIKNHAYNFGKHIALSWQAHVDMQPFVDHQQFPVGVTFDLTSAPVIFHLQHNPSLLHYLMDFQNNLNSVDYKKVHDEIVKSNDGVEHTKKLIEHHIAEAKLALAHFPTGEATEALKNILQSL